MIRLNVNGRSHDIDAAPDTALLYDRALIRHGLRYFSRR
jgi:hypothetical protein